MLYLILLYLTSVYDTYLHAYVGHWFSVDMSIQYLPALNVSICKTHL